MSFKQVLVNCLEPKAGGAGVSAQQLAAAEEAVKAELAGLAAENLKLFDFSDIREKVALVDELAGKLARKYKRLYILGTGGATLCGQTIYGLLENKAIQSRIKFMDNIDPKSFEIIRKKMKCRESFVLVISKSGGTLETISQFAFFTSLYEEKLGTKSLAEHFMVVTDTDNDNNIIRNIAEKLSIPVYPHEKVGGRFSIYSMVGLIPARFGKIKIDKFLKGAEEEVRRTFVDKRSQSITGAALNHALAERGNINSTVMMPYVDRLRNFTTWWAQIWAESLGKNDIATTPIRSLGTLDQHSQMQLFLQGRKDKFFNVMYVKSGKKESPITLNQAFREENLDYISGRKFSDVMNSAALASIETLVESGNPVRVFEIDKLDERTLGSLTMHFILETVLLAKLWKLNPFDQPAVERGKKLTIEMLKRL